MKKILFYVSVLFCLLTIWPSGASAASASLYLSPGSSTVTTGQTFNVGIYLNLSGDTTTVIQSDISFNGGILEATAVTGNLCTIQFNGSEIAAGSVSIARGCTSAVSGSGQLLNTITFRAKTAGSTQLQFLSSTVVTSNTVSVGSLIAGLVKTGSTITVNNPPVVTVAPSKPYAPAVYSSSHPDETKWYKERNVKLSWAKASGVTDFSYSWDSNAGTVPDEATEGSAVTKEYSNVADGTYYLHIKAKSAYGWGTVRHFKVGIDNVNPENLNISFEAGGNPLEPQNLVKAEATDALSGIDHYAVKVDSGEYVDQAIPYILPFKDTNSHDISVKAFDKAGNFIESSKKFSAKEVKIPIPVIGSISSNFTITAGNTTNMTKEYIIKGTGTANTTVKITIDGKEKGEANVNDKGVWTITVKDLTVGEHNLSAKTKFGDKNSEETGKLKFQINEDGSLVLGDKVQKNTPNYMYLYILGGVLVLGGIGFAGYKFWFKKRKVGQFKKNKYANGDKDGTDINNLGDFLKH
ncbi:hypothetical protein AUK11_03095 [bacterium CG2_30_37_16]|nr:MAG: hypothetical protein AUK11_03095 [bacterium CG2_30_37_16]PIP30214.1 MAG: hypothetical protein COX25_05685 [bacterium (Candidatus Howlettbacteria) CG23_combo_of_CG06-09_8_20_14_all_37_9]PIY00188.1 MAG: hypothetical protein COZ22_00810 [bacterium (Candidatus Howlettbacteria) CG_4_10_14_3_um_filter_37_10]PJB07256.1 MAG: hypothetical protein CO123_00680 [bacterium (Candidatus Howlettbacteria) CG_4_9_14_3_um_filter_37_10]